MFYHVCYDAVLSLAYALERVVENESGYALRKMNDKIRSQCINNSYTENISSFCWKLCKYYSYTHKHSQSNHRYTLDCFTI